jgi:16S rRNA (cytosine967-C5)-methyltransferase
MSEVSPARRIAYGILKAIENGKGHSDDLLRGKSVTALSESDRHLTTALVLGVLRWQIALDQRIRPLLKHPNAKVDGEVLIALRLGAFQLLHMDRIPTHAAIDESVELTKQTGHRFASGMVNAVLRKLALSRDAAPLDEGDCLQGFPAWMIERWSAHYGVDAARGICSHGQRQPDLTLRIAGDDVEAELTALGVSLSPGRLLTAARDVTAGDAMRTAALSEGRIRFQDEGSQLVAELAPRGSAILDCCAAPGGKTLILAERNPDANIVACESSPQRLAHLRERLATVGDRVECRLADAAALEDEGVYDVVLVDVPCSGTGTLGRNPEIRHRLLPEDLPRQAERQRNILRAAIQAAHGAGHVIYSTCSLEPEENERVVEAVLAERQDARLISLGTRIEELRTENIIAPNGAIELLQSISPEGYLRLLPGVYQTDGFFVALIEKTS